MTDSQCPPDDFAGFVRLFPLPDLVMFPHVVQPLRIFEPRYVQLLRDALQSDRLIAMALLQAGWEHAYDAQPPTHAAVCVGRVLSYSRQPDGSYNVLLKGLVRGRLRCELELVQPYRRAEIDWLPDRTSDVDDSLLTELRAELLSTFVQLNVRGLSESTTLQKLLHDQVSLSVLADVISFAAPLPTGDKQTLLGEPAVAGRVRLLIGMLRQLVAGTGWRRHSTFPPDFSIN